MAGTSLLGCPGPALDLPALLAVGGQGRPLRSALPSAHTFSLGHGAQPAPRSPGEPMGPSPD